MVLPSRYWTMQVVDSPRIEGKKLKGGYKPRRIHQAQEFFKSKFPDLFNQPTLSLEQNRAIQTILWKSFSSIDDVHQRALVGLCIRCYISYRILITCKTIPHIYNASAENLFSYLDLLPFVLNDSGRALVILDSEGQTQHILNHHGTTQPIAKGGEFFSVEILRKFNPSLSSNESLDNWTTRLTRQNENIRLFLWEYGLATPSDWGLLCRNIPRTLEARLQIGDGEIIRVFHAVYRRDRCNLNQKGLCTEPTPNQLQEMLGFLRQKDIILSPKELISHLKRIAEVSRQDWLYRKTGSHKTIPTEVYDNVTNIYLPNPELPYYKDPDLEEMEFNKLKEYCNALFEKKLFQSITEAISIHIEYLSNSKGYKDFAQRFDEGLQLYYQENKSLGEIANIWGINWSKARRIFQLENLLDNVQYRTEEKLIEAIFQPSYESRLTVKFSDQEHFNIVVHEIKAYVVAKAFQSAKVEIQNGKKQVKNSLFAKTIRRYLISKIGNVE